MLAYEKDDSLSFGCYSLAFICIIITIISTNPNKSLKNMYIHLHYDLLNDSKYTSIRKYKDCYVFIFDLPNQNVLTFQARKGIFFPTY